MMINIYEAIATALQSNNFVAYLNDKNLPVVQHLTLFNSQYLLEPTEEHYTLPAVFIEFASRLFNEVGVGRYQATDSIRVHVEMDLRGDYAETGDRLSTAKQVLVLADEVAAQLNNLDVPGLCRLNLLGMATPTNFTVNPVVVIELAGKYDIDLSDRNNSLTTAKGYAINVLTGNIKKNTDSSPAYAGRVKLPDFN